MCFGFANHAIAKSISFVTGGTSLWRGWNIASSRGCHQQRESFRVTIPKPESGLKRRGSMTGWRGNISKITVVNHECLRSRNKLKSLRSFFALGITHGMSKYKIKDCSERKSFETLVEAYHWVRWQNANTFVHGSVPFQCERCQRWHICPGHTCAEKLRKQLAPIRCVTTRDLHLQMARVMGISLDELQSRTDLSKVKITGPAVEAVTLKGEKRHWP
jgi:hypothetical protein